MTQQGKIFSTFFKGLKAGKHNICCALKLLLPAVVTFTKKLFLKSKSAETSVNAVVSAG